MGLEVLFRKGLCMSKPVFIILILYAILSAQDITVSKDSILVYNNSLSSYADEVTFTSHSAAAIHLDSAFVLVEELDTTGYGRPGMQLAWRATLPLAQQFVWAMDTAGPNNYRLVKDVFYPGTTEPLTFSGNGATSQIFFLEIGFCFQCEIMPKYLRYIKGKLKFYFSNGQIVELKIKSNDLRTAVRRRSLVSASDKGLYKGEFRCLANGKRVNNKLARFRKIQAAVSYLPDEKR
jgi:hypothetical protein